MTAAVIRFPRPLKPQRIVLSDSEGGVRVGVSPERCQQDRDFAQTFTRPAEARAFAGELLATFSNAFDGITDEARRA